MIREKILSAIKNNNLIAKGDKVVIGVSGGADSVCLLYILKSIQKDIGFNLHVVHVNHKLRGRSSNEDEAFVKRFSEGLDLPFTSFSADLRGDTALEEKGRKARYELFTKACKDTGAAKIAVAHNADDNIETMLMWLIRGAGAKGLAGIPIKRQIASDSKITIIRPLLNVYRQEIEAYLKSNNINFQVDHTNNETKFFRNKVRNELIPLMQSYNPSFKQHLQNTSAILQEEDLFLEELANSALESIVIERCSVEDIYNIVIDFKKFMVYNTATKRRVLYDILQKNAGFSHISRICRLIETNNNNFSITLPGKICLSKEYNKLVFSIKKDDSRPLLDTTQILFGEKISFGDYFFETAVITKEEIEDLKDKKCAFFDYELIKEKKIELRFWHIGDRFQPYGSKGSKKIQDYFSDEKIAPSMRHRLPLLTADNKIIWIAGYRSSDEYKVTDKTKKVLKIKMSGK
ncbi:MAG: tRNA lysidine(34) synthetase TilS [Elusimicrobiota bacterium]